YAPLTGPSTTRRGGVPGPFARSRVVSAMSVSATSPITERPVLAASSPAKTSPKRLVRLLMEMDTDPALRVSAQHEDRRPSEPYADGAPRGGLVALALGPPDQHIV